MSRLITRTPCSDTGTSPAMMRCARPSMMAVLPTPGSPINTGLFLLRRDKICTVRRISSSRPTTGSSFPFRASFVKSRAYRSSDSYLLSAPWSVTTFPPRSFMTAASRRPRSTPMSEHSAAPKRSSAAAASTRCSTATKSSPICVFFRLALSTRDSRCRPSTCCAPPLTLGCRLIKRSMKPAAATGSAPASVTMRTANASFCSKSALHRCSVATICCCALDAISGASTMASQARSVNSFCEIFFCAPPSARGARGPRRGAARETRGAAVKADLPRTAEERRNAMGVAAWDAIIAGIADASASNVAEEGGASGVPARRAVARCGCAADHGATYVPSSTSFFRAGSSSRIRNPAVSCATGSRFRVRSRVSCSIRLHSLRVASRLPPRLLRPSSPSWRTSSCSCTSGWWR